MVVDSGRSGRWWRAELVAEAGTDLRRRPVAQLRPPRDRDRRHAFARWDRAHLHMFDLGESGGLLIDQYWDDAPSDSRVDDTVNLSTLGRRPAVRLHLRPRRQLGAPVPSAAVLVGDAAPSPVGQRPVRCDSEGVERVDPLRTDGAQRRRRGPDAGRPRAGRPAGPSARVGTASPVDHRPAGRRRCITQWCYAKVHG